jgi:hypothetical protein
VDVDKADERWETFVAWTRRITGSVVLAWSKFWYYVSLLFFISLFGLIPWMIYDVAAHATVRKQVGHNLWHQLLWIFAGYVLTKIWKYFKGAKRERTKVQSSKPQSWGRNQGGIQGRGKRHRAHPSV